MLRAFDNAVLGFTFDEPQTVEGQETVLGVSEDGLARIALVGPQTDLNSASIWVWLKDDSVQVSQLSNLYLKTFFDTVAPHWAHARDWFTYNLPAALRGVGAELLYGQLLFEMWVDPSTNVATVLVTRQ
jgi:hypothetical protein